MAPHPSRVTVESARRVSDCVTGLVRAQPFFGSLALRLPLCPDLTRKTLASDGQNIRYSPQWIADTDAHLVEAAIARVLLACALKHHTRRNDRDPERWQRASQLVTHGMLRDAGFTLPEDAEAWEGMSVEEAYNRLPEPEPEGGGSNGDPQPDAGMAMPGAAGADDDSRDSGDADDAGDSVSDDSRETPGDPDHGDDQNDPGQPEDEKSRDFGNGAASDAQKSHDPLGTGEVMDSFMHQDRAAGDSAGGGGGGFDEPDG